MGEGKRGGKSYGFLSSLTVKKTQFKFFMVTKGILKNITIYIYLFTNVFIFVLIRLKSRRLIKVFGRESEKGITFLFYSKVIHFY